MKNDDQKRLMIMTVKVKVNTTSKEQSHSSLKLIYW